MYKINIKNSVWKDVKKIDKKISEKIFDEIENKLSHNPINISKELKGHLKGCYSYRIGDYRVLFWEIDENTILISRIAHRKEVYNQ